MRIGKADFEVGNIGRVHEVVLQAVPEEDAVDETELRAAYAVVIEEDKPPFEKVMENLSYLLMQKEIDGRVFYRRKTWLSSADVAKILDVSQRTVQSWGQQGVKGAQWVGKRLRFTAKTVEEWVRGERQQSPHSTNGKAKSGAVNQVWDNEEDSHYDRL